MDSWDQLMINICSFDNIYKKKNKKNKTKQPKKTF